MRGCGRRTNFRWPLRSQDVDALDDGGARVVDAVDEGLGGGQSLWDHRIDYEDCIPSAGSSWARNVVALIVVIVVAESSSIFAATATPV